MKTKTPSGSESSGLVTASVQPLTGVGRALSYAVPAGLRETVVPGSLVRIPLLNRTELGVVRALGEGAGGTGGFGGSAPPAGKLRQVLGPVYPHPVLTPDLIELADWMGRYYALAPEAVFEAMIPAPVRKGMAVKRRRVIAARRGLGAAEREQLERRAPAQAKLYAFLEQQFKPLPKTVVLNRLGISEGSCRGLVQKGWVEESEERVERVAYDDAAGAGELAGEIVPAGGFKLNPEQSAAAATFMAGLDAGGFQAHLLHGVTGSGKTEVYLRALRRALELGGGVLFLVPEVALTPQTVGRLRARLEEAGGEKAVVWHSHLSDGERLDAWHALATGEARVVVGARSAVFAPVPDLRLVIVDEEHEPAYKQDDTPRYHGRDVAVYRAWRCGALCVLGSATPSLESLYNVKVGKYRLSELTKRVDDRQLPLIHVVDMTREVRPGKGRVTLSTKLAELLADRFEKREQSILFINRRGYSSAMLCPECGWVAGCPHCSLTLTWHRAAGVLRCHLCDFEREAPRRCEQCRSEGIHWRGLGTQRVEEAVGHFLPRARVVRMDSDAMSKKHLFRQVLDDFRRGRIDVLVGTQMIAKGLDFPNVTLVGLVAADLSLHVPDFRAGERTFQLIVQVAGRAGRGERAGEVVVQSFLPGSDPVQFAKRGDINGFLQAELEQRREYRYPPYRHLVRHLFRGVNPDKVSFFAEGWVRHITPHLPPEVEVRGPSPAPLEKIKDHYRFQVWYFVENVSRTVPVLARLRAGFTLDPQVIDVIDVDPVSLG